MLLLFPQSFSFLGQFLDKIILSVACPSRQTTNTRLKTCAFVAKRLYCFLAHPLLGLLLGKLDRILGYIYSHGMIWQVNVFALITDFYFPATVLQFLSCFFAFHMFSL